ncbi:MAG: winged helix-turn-helix domain-containing protein [bacterium]|jgi:DNA-binding response OmpR family regulator
MTTTEMQGAVALENYRDRHIEIDYTTRSLRVDSVPVTLTRKEFALLAALASNAGEIMRRDVLLSRIWGYGPMIRTRTLDVHIRRLRKKLGVHGDSYIETIFGVGYRFQPAHGYRAPLLTMGAMQAIA